MFNLRHSARTSRFIESVGCSSARFYGERYRLCARPIRQTTLVARCEDAKNAGTPQPQPQRPSSRKGKMFEDKKRRKGRPAYLRSPYDTPLRDGNRDRLIGFLTERAAKTLMCYLMETNLNVYHWLASFYTSNPIPKNGNWDDVSGETFLRTLLSMPVESASFGPDRDPLYSNAVSCGVDPRSIAQRIMEIRSQLAKEFIQDLSIIEEENGILYRETLNASFANMFSTAASNGSPGAGTFVHPELVESAESNNLGGNQAGKGSPPTRAGKEPPKAAVSTSPGAGPGKESGVASTSAFGKGVTGATSNVGAKGSSSVPNGEAKPARPSGSSVTKLGMDDATSVGKNSADMKSTSPQDLPKPKPDNKDA